MAHDHDHHHGESYYLDQLCTVAASGLLAGLTLLIWKANLLFAEKDGTPLLASQFKIPILLGSVALLGVVVARAVTLWVEVGKKKAAAAHEHAHAHSHHHHEHGELVHDHHHHHEHGEHCDHEHGEHVHDHHHHHEHGEDCDHDHGDHHHHDHDHAHHHHEHDHAHEHAHGDDHGHDHGFAPWRYAVLLMPLMLAGLLLYYHYQGLDLAYSAERISRQLGTPDPIEGGSSTVAEKGEIPLRFDELTIAASVPHKRSYYEGHLGKLRGKYEPITDHQFTLYRMKITCCASDAIPLQVRIISPDPLPQEIVKGDWIEATGQIQFRKKVGKEEYLPVLVTSPAGIKKTTATSSLYEQ